MTDSRALVYAVEDDGSTGELLAVGSLLLPYLVVIHPDLSGADPAARGARLRQSLNPLREAVTARAGGSFAVRTAFVPGRRPETVDGVLFHGATTHDDDEWLGAVLLERPADATVQPFRVPATTAPSLSGLFSHFDRAPLRLRRRDRSRRPPTGPTPAPASEVAPIRTAWPDPLPTTEGFDIVKDRPDVWPHGVPYPPIEIELQILLSFCPWCAIPFCKCR